MEDRYYKTDEGQIVDTSTGEIVDVDEIEKAISKNVIDNFTKANRDLHKLGLDTNLRIIRARDGQLYPCAKIKERYVFNKVFRVEVRNMLDSSNLSIYALAFITKFEPHLYFPTNSVVINGKRPTIEQMWEMLGVKKTKMYEILKELEKHDVIKRIDLNGFPVIYFNPFLYSCGGLVDRDTYNYFEDSIYNPINKVDME